MKWANYCVISEISRSFRAIDPNANPVVYKLVTATNSATFHINNVTLPINDNIKFLESIKQGLKRTTSWNKHRSEITAQTKNNNSYYLTDPTFRNINRLFVLFFKNGANHPIRNSFYNHYMSLVEIKGFNFLIDNKPFFYQPVKNKQEACEKLIKMSRNDDLLDFSYNQNYYKLIGIDLPRQVNTGIPQ